MNKYKLPFDSTIKICYYVDDKMHTLNHEATTIKQAEKLLKSISFSAALIRQDKQYRFYRIVNNKIICGDIWK